MLFASGAAALIFQIVWVRQLSLIVGVDVFAITVAVSSFFGGLAIGGFLFGNLVERSREPLRLYSFLELAAGASGVISTALLARAPLDFVSLERFGAVVAWGLPFLLVGVPATFMGGTLPVLMKACVRSTAQIGATGGRLYAANTAGAILGALLTAYFLIPIFGLFGSSLVAALLNGGSAWLASVGWNHEIKTTAASLPKAQAEGRGFWLGPALYAMAGGIALGYEVVWSQIVVQWTSTRSFAFATVLAVYLGGLALGGALGGRFAKPCRDPWGSFGFLIAVAGLAALLQMLMLGQWLDQLQVEAATIAFHIAHNEQVAMSARFLVAAGCVLLIPAIALGVAFPYALRLSEEDSAVGRNTGRTLAANTLGGIVGTLTTGFVLVPALGVERSLAFLAAASGLVGIFASLRATPGRRAVVVSAFLLTLVASMFVNSGRFGNLLAARHQGRLIFEASGAGGTVAVIEQGSRSRTFRRLYIQGVSNSGDSMTSLRYMRLQALLPLIIHRDEPKSALVIGLGTGITAGSLLNFDGLERRVCAELLPEVIEAASRFQGNENATGDPRLEIRRVDGRHELLRRSDRYDLVTLEPPPPSAAGVANLYSTEFYRLANSRLTPHGIVAQWLPLPTQSDADTRSLVRSFLDVFPHASLWTTELHEMLLMGSPAPLELDAVTIQKRFEQERVRRSLGEVGVGSPAALLATYVCGRDGLEEYARNALPVTDDRPRIEYGRWTVPGDFPRTFQSLMALRSEPVVENADDRLRVAIADQRITLHRFYAASIAAYEGDRSRWKEAIDAVFQSDPDNAYFQWFQAAGDSSPFDPSGP